MRHSPVRSSLSVLLVGTALTCVSSCSKQSDDNTTAQAEVSQSDSGGLAPASPAPSMNAASTVTVEPASLPTIDVSAPNQVDKASSRSSIVLDGDEAYFSAPIRQVYWQGSSMADPTFTYSMVARFSDGSVLSVTLPFDPKVASSERKPTDFAEAGRFDLTQKEKQQWLTISGTATLEEHGDRLQIKLAKLELQNADDEKMKRSIAAGTIEGALERACYAHAKGSADFADPALDEQWSSDFCRPYK